MIYKLVKKPFFSRFQKPWQWPQKYLQQNTWTEHSFKSDSGARISALIGESFGEKARGNIVCSHPMGVGAKGYFLKRDIADYLRNQGFNVLLFDFNGFGNSTDGTLDLPADVYAAGKYFQEIKPDLNLGVLGISFGASMAVCSMSRKDNPFNAAVFESAFTSLVEFWSHFGLLGKLMKLFPLLMPAKERSMNALYHSSRIVNTKNILWIHGADDIQTPPEMGIRFEKECNVPSQRWIVPRGKHADCFDRNPDEYQNRVAAFFNKYL